MLSLEPLLVLFFLILSCLVLENFIKPKTGRYLRPSGFIIHSLLMANCYGCFLFVSGSPLFSAFLTWGIALAFVIASNLKWAILGEPLVFSDLSIVKDIAKHPNFYIFAIPIFTRLLVGIALLCIPAGYIWAMLQPCPMQIRLLGFFLSATSGLLLAALPTSKLIAAPALKRDIAHFGLFSCLFIYWRCWQKQPLACAPPPLPANPAFDLVVVVQCESFTDPSTLHLPTDMVLPCMPELTKARQMASDYGNLEVSGFGAYTIRTEYGVLFGRSEQELGFQQFDPFLTAKHEKAFSLPYKFGQAGFKSVFLHPYNLDFSNRRSLMAHIGFETVLGAESFSHTSTPDMPYVSDKSLADKIISLCSNTPAPLFLYAVTIENHGPWKEQGTPLTSYLEHLKNSDQMIGQLIKGLDFGNKSALFVFFGDHRPSIPPELPPNTERSTPYFIIPFSRQGSEPHNDNPTSLTPAQLHNLIEKYSLNITHEKPERLP